MVRCSPYLTTLGKKTQETKILKSAKQKNPKHQNNTTAKKLTKQQQQQRQPTKKPPNHQKNPTPKPKKHPQKTKQTNKHLTQTTITKPCHKHKKIKCWVPLYIPECQNTSDCGQKGLHCTGRNNSRTWKACSYLFQLENTDMMMWLHSSVTLNTQPQTS